MVLNGKANKYLTEIKKLSELFPKDIFDKIYLTKLLPPRIGGEVIGNDSLPASVLRMNKEYRNKPIISYPAEFAYSKSYGVRPHSIMKNSFSIYFEELKNEYNKYNIKSEMNSNASDSLTEKAISQELKLNIFKHDNSIIYTSKIPIKEVKSDNNNEIVSISQKINNDFKSSRYDNEMEKNMFFFNNIYENYKKEQNNLDKSLTGLKTNIRSIHLKNHNLYKDIKDINQKNTSLVSKYRDRYTFNSKSQYDKIIFEQIYHTTKIEKKLNFALKSYNLYDFGFIVWQTRYWHLPENLLLKYALSLFIFKRSATGLVLALEVSSLKTKMTTSQAIVIELLTLGISLDKTNLVDFRHRRQLVFTINRLLESNDIIRGINMPTLYTRLNPTFVRSLMDT